MHGKGGEICQAGHIVPFQLEGNRDQLVALVGLGHFVARELHVKVLGHGVIVDAQLTHFVLVDMKLHHGCFLRPIEAGVGDIRMLLHDVQGFFRQFRRFFHRVPGQAEHDGILRWRAGGDEAGVGASLRIGRVDEVDHFAPHRVAGFLIGGHDDHLAMAIFCGFRIEEQDESGRRVADVGGEGRNPIVPIEAVGDAIHHFLGFPDGRAAGEVHIQNDFRSHGVREEFLIHHGNRRHGEGEDAGGGGDDCFPEMNANGDDFVEKVIGLLGERALISFLSFFRFSFLFGLYFDEFISQHRAHKDGGNPGEDQSGCDDPEHGRRILGGLPFGQAHRDEAGGGDEGACQHGLRAALVGCFRRFHAREALLQLHLHHFDDDDGIIHQEPQGHDEGAQRHDMKVDALPFHEEESSAHHHRDAEGKDNAAPQAQGQEGRCHDDDDGF